MNLRPHSFLLVSVALAACAPRLPLGAGLDRLRQTMVAPPGARTLAELDVSGDAVLDDTDGRFFADLAAAARAELDRRGLAIDVGARLYHGAPDGEPALWQLLTLDAEQRLDLAALTDERLIELAIESRWLALQVDVARAAGARPEPARFFASWPTLVPGLDPDAMDPAAVCGAVEALDLAPLRRAGVTPAVVLDLDSTIWDGNVMDPFLAALVGQGKIAEEVNGALRDYLRGLADVDPEALARATATENAALLLARWTDTSLPAPARPNAKDMFYLIVKMLRGMSTTDGEAAARAVFADPKGGFPAWDRRAFADQDGCSMRQLLTRMQARGIEVYVLSATLDLLAVEGARVLGVPESRTLGSVLEVVDGRYTGEVKDSAYYTKGAITRQWLPAPPLLAFGDSPSSDLSMLLEAFAASFMINPRPAFVELDAQQADSKLVAVTFDGTEESLAAAR